MKCINFLVLFCLFFSDIKSQDIFDAVRKGNLDRLKVLYQLNPDTINSKNGNEFTPLILAVYNYQHETASYLLEHGASVNANSPEGTALLAAVYKNNYEMVELLIKHKVNPDLTNEEGLTALMYAAMNNNLKIADLLLKNSANKTLISKSGHTALSYAKMYELKDMMALLSK
jgi:uncharacterized protein